MGSAMPIRDFLKNFFPNLPHRNSEERRGVAPWMMDARIVHKIRASATTNSERGIATAWAEWMQQAGIRCPCPGYRLSLSQDRYDKFDQKKLKVDGALHPADAVPVDGRPHWEALCALLEFKAGGTQFDPYDDVKQGDADAETRINVRGQLTEYVAQSFGYQHRTAMFLFLINGSKMRATRWDRSGTIFTEAFDYTRQRDLLRDLLWGFSRLSPREQGVDYSAVPLKPGSLEYQMMTLLAKACDSDICEEEGTIVDSEVKGPYVFRHVRAAFRDAIADDAPRYRLSVPTSAGDQYYLVGKPTIVAAGMSGRGTRGYVAWDVAGERFVWLKDAWRPIYDNVTTEGSVLRTLNGAGVRNVPTYVCDGELEDETETPKWAKPPFRETSNTQNEGGRKGTKRAHDGLPVPGRSPNPFVNRGKHIMRKFRHYRLVVEEVCLSLTMLQLLAIVRDCVQAHADAVNMTQTLHRDVSAGNVLICPTVVRSEVDGQLRVVWKGILTDWELSKPMTPANGKLAARQPVRTGTWQFTAARVLDNPASAVVTADELESFFYVILYNALRFLRHTCANIQLAMFDYFDGYDFVEGQYRCGGHKRSSMESGKLPKMGGRACNWVDDSGNATGHPINAALATLLMWFRARYTVINAGADEDDYIARLSGFAPEVSDSVRAVAEKLDSHTAALSLFDELLGRDWPQLDKLGDLIQNPDLAYVEQKAAEDPTAGVAKPTDEDSSPCPSDDPDGEPQSKRPRRHARKSRAKAPMPVVMEEDDVLPQLGDSLPETQLRPTVTQSRTRGGRRTRAAARAGAGSSSRKPST